MKIYRVYFIYLGGGVCRFLLTMDITGKCTKHLKIELCLYRYLTTPWREIEAGGCKRGFALSVWWTVDVLRCLYLALIILIHQLIFLE